MRQQSNDNNNNNNDGGCNLSPPSVAVADPTTSAFRFDAAISELTPPESSEVSTIDDNGDAAIAAAAALNRKYIKIFISFYRCPFSIAHVSDPYLTFWQNAM